MLPMAVTVSKPNDTISTVINGANAIISCPMPKEEEQNMKKNITPAIMTLRLRSLPNFFTSMLSADSIAPVEEITPSEPPMSSRKEMMDEALFRPASKDISTVTGVAGLDSIV